MDKSITNIETVSNADIQNAEFYIAVNNSFVKAPFEPVSYTHLDVYKRQNHNR